MNRVKYTKGELSVPAAIVLGCIILGGFYFISRVNMSDFFSKQVAKKSEQKVFYTQSSARVRSCGSLTCSELGQLVTNTKITDLPYSSIKEMPDWVSLNWTSDGATTTGYISKTLLGENEVVPSASDNNQIKQKSLSKPEDQVQLAGQDSGVIDINQYIIGVVEIQCHGSSPSVGSGSLWYINGTYRVLTNAHVLSTNDCRVYVDDSDHKKGGEYFLDLNNLRHWNSYTDVATVPILGNDGTFPNVTPLSDLFYGIGTMQRCSSKVAQGSPVYVIGYPSSSMKKNYVGNNLYFEAFRTLTTGVVSGYDDTVTPPQGSLPYVNYFISAKIDSGNSGGVAISKENNQLCLLGLPTWLNVGNYDSQGIVQNINNIIYVTPN